MGSVGRTSGPLAPCSYGDHSVTAMPGPGETTCSASNNRSLSIGGLNGTVVLPLIPPGSEPGKCVKEGGALPYEPPGTVHNLDAKHHPTHVAPPSAASVASHTKYWSAKTLAGCVREVSCEDETVRCLTGSNYASAKSLVPITGVLMVGSVGAPPVIH